MHGHAAHARKPRLCDAQLVPSRHKRRAYLFLVHLNEYYTTFRPKARADNGLIFTLLNTIRIQELSILCVKDMREGTVLGVFLVGWFVGLALPRLRGLRKSCYHWVAT